MAQALNTEKWTDGDPTDTEKDFWEIAALESYNHLTQWKSLQYCATVNIDHSLDRMWEDPFYQVDILSDCVHVIKHIGETHFIFFCFFIRLVHYKN